MSNSEWMQSAPGTPTEKIELLRCFDCHGLQRPIFSKENASEMAQTVQRMGVHAANASPNFPFFLQDASSRLSQPPNKGQMEFGAYLASINLEDAGMRHWIGGLSLRSDKDSTPVIKPDGRPLP